MNRQIPYDETAVCDQCGKLGANDFMGNFVCDECVKTCRETGTANVTAETVKKFWDLGRVSQDENELIEFETQDGHIIYLWEANKQEYSDCEFSSGIVYGLLPEEIYLQLKRDGEEPTTLFFRRDEAAAIGRIIDGSLWSLLLGELDNNK